MLKSIKNALTRSGDYSDAVGGPYHRRIIGQFGKFGSTLRSHYCIVMLPYPVVACVCAVLHAFVLIFYVFYSIFRYMLPLWCKSN